MSMSGSAVELPITTDATPEEKVSSRQLKKQLRLQEAKTKLSSPWASGIAIILAILWTITTFGLFVTSFYNGSMLLKVKADGATEVWRSKAKGEMPNLTTDLSTIMPTPWVDGNYIYGVCSYGQLRCLKAETGERVWETFKATTDGNEMRWANAFIVKNGSRFFLFNEKGDLIIAKLTPAGYNETSRAHLLEPLNTMPGRNVVWSHPAFANRCIYARNDKEIVCANLALEK